MYTVILYYKICRISSPRSEVATHKALCKQLGLKGRVLINEAGINGTLGGEKESIQAYVDAMNTHPELSGIDFKFSNSEVEPFPKLRIVYRDEIITTGVKQDIDFARRGKHVDRDTFHSWLKSGEEMVLLDLRNDYEWEVGRFKNAIKPPMKYFRDISEYYSFYEQFKGKKIVMYCTGGIRCEPGSALLVGAGLDPENTYQLEGGIVKYCEKYGNEGFFEGVCFVFDERMIVPVRDDKEPEKIANCAHCSAKTFTFQNCANKYCNLLFLCCDDCAESLRTTCSKECLSVTADASALRPPRVNAQKVLHRNK